MKKRMNSREAGKKTAIKNLIWIATLLIIVAPSFLEPEGGWRWAAILSINIILVAVFIQGYYGWLIQRKSPISILQNGGKRKFNPSQKKWQLAVFYFAMLVAGPFIIYLSHFTVIDAINIAKDKNYIKLANIEVMDRNVAMGAWFIGQSLEIKQDDVFDRSLILMFSAKPALENQEYQVKYLPYSGLILEIGQ